MFKCLDYMFTPHFASKYPLYNFVTLVNIICIYAQMLQGIIAKLKLNFFFEYDRAIWWVKNSNDNRTIEVQTSTNQFSILTLLKFDANKMSKLKLPQNNYKFAERSNRHMNAENHIVDEWVKCGWRWIKFFLTWDLLSGSSSDASLIHAFFKSFFLLFDHFISVIFGMREII